MSTQTLEVKKLVQHPLHKEMFGDPSESQKDLSSLKSAFERQSKILPVLFTEVTENGVTTQYVIDGWSSVIAYREQGIETIIGMKVDLNDPEEIPYVLADLHTNYHSDPEEDYKKFSYFYHVFSMGKGYRSDLINDNE